MPATASSKSSRHVCSDCGRAYKAPETLNRHRKNHSDTISYACSICEASFKRKDLLDRHTQIHTGGKIATHKNRSPRACDRCSRLKTRCDNLTPCSRCSKGGHDCTYKQTRSRVRTDRSSRSTSSSIHSSPHMSSAEELNSIADTPEDISTFDSTSTWPVNDSMVDDSLWLQDLAWEWPEMDSNMPIMSPQPSSLRTTLPPSKDAIESNFALDPTLNLRPNPTNIPSSNLYDSSYNSSMTWYSSRPHDDSLDSLPVGPPCTTPNTSYPPPSDTRRPGRSRSTPTPTPTRTSTTTPAALLVGEAARIAQEATITELVHLSTSSSSLPPTTTDHDHNPQRKHFWQSMSSKTELAFNLAALVPTTPRHRDRDSTIFDHFLALFHTFFRVGFPTARQERHIDAYHPYVCLAMAAIGAAYAGCPQAEGFHLALLDALRPKLIEAAAAPDKADLYPLVEALALVLAAMIHFGHRDALQMAPGLAGLIVGLGRGLGLFGGGGGDAGHDGGLAYGIVRLNAAVACLCGTGTLLREEEKRGAGGNPTRATDVLDRMLENARARATARATAGMEARSGY